MDLPTDLPRVQNTAHASARVHRRRAAVWGAGAVLAIVFGLLIATIVLGSRAMSGWEEWFEVVGFVIWTSAFSVVGLLVVIHRPGNPIAWVCLSYGLVWSLWYFVEILLDHAVRYPGSVAQPALLAALAYPLWVPGVALIAVLLLIFPDGRLPTRRWLWLAWLLGLTSSLLLVTSFFLPGVVQDTEFVNPMGVEALQPFYQGLPAMVLVVSLVLCLGASAVALFTRFRRAVGEERLQLKWLVAAGLMSAVGYALLFVREYPVQLVWATIPVAIGMSMHRHRLYDIDRLISRTVLYSIVLGILAAVYVGLILVLGALIPEAGDLTVAAATLAAVGLFSPVRRKVQAGVERRFNRSRFDAQRVMEKFGGSLRSAMDPEQITRGWVGVVSDTMQPTSVSVWLRDI